VRFFFPDARELVDPGYDFNARHVTSRKVGQREGRYAHELIDPPPYDGILLSRAVIQGKGRDADGHFRGGRYRLSEQKRLSRMGARAFFRAGGLPLWFMGDCGAFSYRDEDEQPFTVDGVLGFYEACRVDLGVSVDHVILGHDPTADDTLPGLESVPTAWKRRQELTLSLAADFLGRHRSGRLGFEPVGVAQGWSPRSYARCVQALQKMGYRRVALGGIVPLRTADVLAVLGRVAEVRRPETRLHLLGLHRPEALADFRRLGVAGFDSTSPLTQAFLDARDNYHTPGRAYTALRLRVADPRVTPELREPGGYGVPQDEALRLEAAAFAALLAYGGRRAGLDEALAALLRYEALFEPRACRAEGYRETLADRPWESCPCPVCRGLGVHAVVFRGAERNRRRGFHNLFVAHRRLRQIRRRGWQRLRGGP
jgi:hypothetical protein